MFGQKKPVVFERYGRRRSRWRLPPWLLLLLVGAAAGAGGLVYVQESHLPQRLTAAESTQLRSDFQRADAERVRLQTALAATTLQLESATADKKRQDAELAAPRAVAQRLQDELSAVIGALPPDPRGGSVEVRAGRFSAERGALTYDVVLSRERNNAPSLAGTVQLSVLGSSARGSDASIELKPVPVSIDNYQVVRGNQPLPAGFKPRQVTIQVLDKPGGKPLGMRVMLLR
jgi:hypothetical protein